MENDQREISNIKTDVAVIKKDMEHINRLITKMDGLVTELSSLTKTIAVQSRILETHQEKIEVISARIQQEYGNESEYRKDTQTKFESIKDEMIMSKEKRHGEILSTVQNLRTELLEVTKEHDTRIGNLEKWKWWVMGAGAVLGTFISMLWKTYAST
jgi:chromosome segregation ATPase